MSHILIVKQRILSLMNQDVRNADEASGPPPIRTLAHSPPTAPQIDQVFVPWGPNSQLRSVTDHPSTRPPGSNQGGKKGWREVGGEAASPPSVVSQRSSALAPMSPALARHGICVDQFMPQDCFDLTCSAADQSRRPRPRQLVSPAWAHQFGESGFFSAPS